MKKILFLMLALTLLVPTAFAALEVQHAKVSDVTADKQGCLIDADCIAAQCCHATSAVNKTYAPDCGGVVCTAECTAKTADCGQGKVKCVNKECAIKLRAEGDIQFELAAKFAGETNQNAVRAAVHTLLAAENISGGIGKEVSAVAREFDNSKSATDDAEKKIQERSNIRKYFFGGHVDAAAKIESEVAKNNERIAKLKTMLEQCTDCEPETTAIIQEKITAIEAENTRLQNLATSEKAKKGLFGFWKK